MKKPRVHDLGWTTSPLLPPGPLNAITDVAGVKVGHTTIIKGPPGPLEVGVGPVRTGVTAIIPHGDNLYLNKVAGAFHVLNAFGKTTGLEQLRELGAIETPILLTNTLNVWRVADALVDWMLAQMPGIGITTRGTVNPIVGECNDGYLSDIQGRHVGRAEVWGALEGATGGPIPEGNVGAGTGTTTYGLKGGIGTASRVVPKGAGGFTVGVLVQSNFGKRNQLTIRGVPVGEKLQNWPPQEAKQPNFETDRGSCMIVVATDAPLSSRQLGRLARRAPLGMARTGSVSGPGSGDYVIAFSTTNRKSEEEHRITHSTGRLADEWVNFGHLIQAVVEATEEAILNSLVAAETLAGRDGHVAHAIPIDIIQPWLESSHE